MGNVECFARAREVKARGGEGNTRRRYVDAAEVRVIIDIEAVEPGLVERRELRQVFGCFEVVAASVAQIGEYPCARKIL